MLVAFSHEMACYNWDQRRRASSCRRLRPVYLDCPHHPADGDLADHHPCEQARARTCSDLRGFTAARQLQCDVNCSPTDYVRVRSFSTSSRGVKNRGDSFKRQQQRADTVRRVSNAVSTDVFVSGSAASELNVVVVGDEGVGKRSIISQLMTSEYMHGASDNSPSAPGKQT